MLLNLVGAGVYVRFDGARVEGEDLWSREGLDFAPVERLGAEAALLRKGEHGLAAISKIFRLKFQ